MLFRNPSEPGATHRERGQIAVLAAFVIGLMLIVIVTVGVVGAAIIDRTGATVAADAVALADAVDPASAESLASWYRSRGYDVASRGGASRAQGEEARAQSRAVADDELRVAPVIRAIVARAEQLLGRELSVIAAEQLSVTFSPSSADRFGVIAAELGMCPTGEDTFTRC